MLYLSWFLPALVFGTTISNVKPRVDTDGDIINVGDGCITYHDKLYYIYGAAYQCCKEPDVHCYATGAGLALSSVSKCIHAGKVLGKCWIFGAGWHNTFLAWGVGVPLWCIPAIVLFMTPPKVPDGQCCGWRNMTYAVYSSPDLVTWSKVSMSILPIMTDYASPYR